MPPRFPRRGFFWPPIPLPPVLSPRRATQLSERSPTKNLDVLGELAYGLSQDPHLCPTQWSTEGHTQPPRTHPHPRPHRSVVARHLACAKFAKRLEPEAASRTSGSRIELRIGRAGTYGVAGT